MNFTKKKLDACTARMCELMNSVSEKSDQVQQHLTIKFAKEVKMKWYSHMLKIYADLEDIESEMKTIAFD